MNEVYRLDAHTWRMTDGENGSCAYMYLLEGETRAMLIDTGLWAWDVRAKAESLTNKPIFVVNTHGHLDHISANHQFDEAYLSPKDEPVFAEHSSYEVRYGFACGLLREQGLPESTLQEKGMRERVRPMLHLPQRENRKPLAENRLFDLGGRTVRVIETPGHTVGSVCLLDVERRWLFTGDTVCDLGVLLHMPHSATVEVFAQSIEKLIKLAPQFDVMWPGHHRCPLEKELLNAYARCAERAMNGETGQRVESAAGIGQILRQESISLSLPLKA